MMDQPEAFSLRQAVGALFRHGRAIMLTTALALATVGAYLAVTPKEYGAVSHILVGLGREKMADLGMQTGPVGNLVFQERAQNINNEVEVLRDPELMRVALPALKARLAASPGGAGPATPGLMARLHALLVSIGVSKAIDPDTALGIRFYKSLSVTAVKETDVIDVGFTWKDPAFAADALNIYVNAYLAEHLRLYDSKRSVGFFSGQLQKAQAELASADAALAAFMRDGDVTNLDFEKTQKLSELGSLRQEAAAAHAEGDAARQRLGDPDAAGQGSLAVEQNYVQLLGERARLLQRYEAGADPVRAVDAQIARLKSEKAQGLATVYRGRAEAASGRAARLDAEIAATEQSLRHLTERTAAFDVIQRRRQAASGLVEEYRRKLEELQVSSEMNADAFSSIKVLSRASPPVVPSAPKPMLLLPLALGFGLLAGLAFAVVAESLDRTFRQAAQVARQLGVPVLATVPLL
jgi:uncharacterized protein involved in exopolysaccharide biosynthesis